MIFEKFSFTKNSAKIEKEKKRKIEKIEKFSSFCHWKKSKNAKEKTGAIVVGLLGFVLVAVGVALCLPNIGKPLMILGLVLGLIGIMVCALTPVIYKYKNS